MHKILGEFDKDELSFILNLESTYDVSKNLFNKIKAYINNNMFMAFRRQSAKCKKIVVSSVGDHLSKDDEQDILKADLFVDIEIVKELSQLDYDLLMKLSYWPVTIRLQKSNKILEQIDIKINKSDDLILSRKYKKNVR
jgi:hypothetical protein